MKKRIGWICTNCVAPGICATIEKVEPPANNPKPYHCLYENRETRPVWKPLYGIDDIFLAAMEKR